MLCFGEFSGGIITIMAKPARKTVVLPAIVDLDSLDTIRDGLLDAVDDGSVTIAGAGVERVSTNALFMLISAAATARKNNFEFEIEAPSAALTGAIERLGLGASFDGMMRG
jgi:anti-anti-sigma regulatory factor